MKETQSVFILPPSSFIFLQSGRQESNLPQTAYQTVAYPPGPQPDSRGEARLTRPLPLSLVPLSKVGRIRTHCVGFGNRLLSQEHNLVTNCPGRTRTCNPSLNRRPHHLCATGQFQESGVRSQGEREYSLVDPNRVNPDS